jgi:hypothetical protein
MLHTKTARTIFQWLTTDNTTHSLLPASRKRNISTFKLLTSPNTWHSSCELHCQIYYCILCVPKCSVLCYTNWSLMYSMHLVFMKEFYEKGMHDVRTSEVLQWNPNFTFLHIVHILAIQSKVSYSKCIIFLNLVFLDLRITHILHFKLTTSNNEKARCEGWACRFMPTVCYY